MVYLLFTPFVFYFLAWPIRNMLCWGCKVGSGDVQCGVNCVFDVIVCSFAHPFPSRKQGVSERLVTIGQRLATIGQELATIREDLRYIRVEQGKRAITLEEVIKTQGMAERLQQPHALAKSSGMTWTYQNGGDLDIGLCAVFEKNYAAFDAKVRDKQSMEQAIICAGLGMGKSRALMRVPEVLAHKTEGKTVFTFNVSFENGTSYQKEHERPSESAVVDRICFHLLGHTTDDMKAFVVWSEAHRAGFTLDELVERLCKYLGKEEQYPTNVVCLLMIDGVHNLSDNELVSDPESNGRIRSFLREVMLSCQMGSPFFLFSVCTLTAKKTAVDALTGSSVVPHYLQLPFLTKEPETMPKGRSTNLFDIVKGYGRAVEILCNVAKEHPEKDEPELLSILCEQVKIRYNGIVASVEDQTMLLRYALLKVPLKQDTDLAAHLSKGLMDIQKEGENLYLRLSLIWAIVNSSMTGSLLKGYTFAEKQDGASFESFVLWYRCLLSKLHDTGPTSMVLLHKGVQWMNEPSRHEFTNTPLTPRFAVRQTQTRGSKQNVHNNMQSKSSPKNSHHECAPFTDSAFQNAEKAPYGDIFLRLDKDVNEVLQVKHSENEKGAPMGKMWEEVEKSSDKTDVFLWHTTATFPEDWVTLCKQDDNLKDRVIGVVHAGNFEDYYHFFAQFWLNNAQTQAAEAQVNAHHDPKTSTESVLASRPVWPALLSRVPHIPNRTWITPLPPTRTRTTRWVPFLRRICKHS